MKKRYNAEEIIRILRDAERAKSVTDGVRLHGISEQSYYRWKKKYGGVSVDEGKRLKELHRLARKHPRYGYEMITWKLKQRGWRVNKKRIQRLWRLEREVSVLSQNVAFS